MMDCQVEKERRIKYIYVIVSIFQLANIPLQGTGVYLKPNLNVQFLPEDHLPTPIISRATNSTPGPCETPVNLSIQTLPNLFLFAVVEKQKRQ